MADLDVRGQTDNSHCDAAPAAKRKSPPRLQLLDQRLNAKISFAIRAGSEIHILIKAFNKISQDNPNIQEFDPLFKHESDQRQHNAFMSCLRPSSHFTYRCVNTDAICIWGIDNIKQILSQCPGERAIRPYPYS